MPNRIRVKRAQNLDQLKRVINPIPEGTPIYLIDENKLCVSMGGNNANQKPIEVDHADRASNADLADNSKKVYDSYLLDKIYPIGSIYMTTSTSTLGSSSPASWLGGRWQKIEGRFLLGSSGNHTLGSKNELKETQTLAVVNLPPHQHNITLGRYRHGAFGVSGRPRAAWANGDQLYEANPNPPEENTPHTEYTGSGQSFSIMPPYQVVNIWERIE